MKLLNTFFIVAFLHVPLFSAQPNIVFILADDMGYGDLGCYGHPRAKTPVIDRLAKEGVRFTQHYANGPECSPTRTALLTGRYQQRAGGLECAIGTGNVGRYDDAIRLAGQRQLGLPAKQVVLPSALKPAGYTSGVFGKWHLGIAPEFHPTRRGFDEFFGSMGGATDYIDPTREDVKSSRPGRAPRPDGPWAGRGKNGIFSGVQRVEEEDYLTDATTENAVRFIANHKDDPFFLYVPYLAVHQPLVVVRVVALEGVLELGQRRPNLIKDVVFQDAAHRDAPLPLPRAWWRCS